MVLEDIAAVVAFTSYHFDFSSTHGAGNPTDTEKAPNGFERIAKAEHADTHNPFPQLYHGYVYISKQFPESLTFIRAMLILKPPLVVSDLETIDLSSLWMGQWPVPVGQGDGEGHRFSRDHVEVRPHTAPRLSLRSGPTYRGLNNVASRRVTRGWRRGAWRAGSSINCS
jgi:hypothetical protein